MLVARSDHDAPNKLGRIVAELNLADLRLYQHYANQRMHFGLISCAKVKHQLGLF